jgi:cysteine desulfuration protein SufE
MNELGTLTEIREDFLSIESWEERYAYLIELGRCLPEFPSAGRTEENRILGCQSRVWLIPSSDGKGFQFRADSDSAIVRGLIALLMALYLGRSPISIAAIDETAVFKELGLDAHLSAGRRNGLLSLVERIKCLAAMLSRADSGRLVISVPPSTPY